MYFLFLLLYPVYRKLKKTESSEGIGGYLHYNCSLKKFQLLKNNKISRK